jgi:hypothetical protein
MRMSIKLWLAFVAVQVAAIGVLIFVARALKAENAGTENRVRAIGLAPSPVAARLVGIGSENDRLRRDLESIPALRQQSRELQDQIAKEPQTKLSFGQGSRTDCKPPLKERECASPK